MFTLRAAKFVQNLFSPYLAGDDDGLLTTFYFFFLKVNQHAYIRAYEYTMNSYIGVQNRAHVQKAKRAGREGESKTSHKRKNGDVVVVWFLGMLIVMKGRVRRSESVYLGERERVGLLFTVYIYSLPQPYLLSLWYTYVLHHQPARI